MKRLPVLLAVLLVAGAVGGYLFLRSSGAGHPGEWDARVRPIASFVERERGLDFEHPVTIEFMSDDEFEQEITTGQGEITEEEREEIQQFAAFLRALGLLRTEFDLVEKLNDLSAAGVLGFYDPDAERIVIKGTELTVHHRATLAHELTHVLQDQHFGIDRFEDDDRQSGPYHALVEGDADRIEDAWTEDLPRSERRRLERIEDDEFDQAALDEFPPILVDLLTAPYALGAGLITILDAQGGDALNDAFADPPDSDEHLLDPWTYLDGDLPDTVEPPPLQEGETELEVGAVTSEEFGALGWYLLLAERIDPKRALEAVFGWGGDSYVTFQKEGRTCLRAVFVGDEQADTREMIEALEAWLRADPDRSRFKGVTPITTDGAGVTFTSCDPGGKGGDAERRRPTEESPLLLPVARISLAAGMVHAGAPQKAARCAAGKVFTASETSEILTLMQSEEPDPDFVAEAQQAFRDCQGD